MQRHIGLYKPKVEIMTFLSESNFPLADLFSILQIACLIDAFEQLNTLNVYVQGRGHSVFELTEKM